ncbi:MAG: protein-L-isoaspartate O-methyltransferase [Hyphomicrobiaceae bacterium]
MTDYATQRKSMVDSQVRPSDVTDRAIPRAMLEVPRHEFVAEALRGIAYMDDDLRVSDGNGAGRFLLAPRVLSKMMQHLEIAPGNRVLDVACATGYSTAVLAHLGARVVALECDAGLAEQCRAALAGTKDVQVVTGPLRDGAAMQGPYDAILINGAVADIPAGLRDQLKDGGRLVAVEVRGGVGKAVLWKRTGTRFDSRELFDASAPMLPGFEPKREFVF